MRNTLKILATLLSIGTLFGLSACSSTGDELDRWDEAKLFKEAKGAMKRGEFIRAVKRLEALEARYPFGDYSIQGQLDLMYSYQRSGVPDDAVATAKRFRHLHPTHPKVDYSYYVQGVAEFDRHKSLFAKWFPRDPSKYDQKPLENAYNAFYQLTVRFPGSIYAADARQRMIFLKNTLATACIDTANWYDRRGAYLASAIQAQECLQRYDGAVAAESALALIYQGYEKMGVADILPPLDSKAGTGG